MVNTMVRGGVEHVLQWAQSVNHLNIWDRLKPLMCLYNVHVLYFLEYMWMWMLCPEEIDQESVELDNGLK